MSGTRLFISYSHHDQDWLERIKTQFSVMERQGQVAAWSDREIQGGERWHDKIDTAMREADVAVLLVSANFLSSDFIMEKELPTLFKKLNDEKSPLRHILPLIVSPCLWKDIPDLKQLEVRPKGHELSAGTPYEQDVDLRDFAIMVSNLGRKFPKSKLVEGGDDTGGTVVGAKDYATLELRLSHCEWNNYRVEMNFTWSGDRENDFSRRYGACLDVQAFAGSGSAANYAEDLYKALFPNEEALQAVNKARQRADEKEVPLRVRICIESSARELHSLNWEKLTTMGGQDNPLAVAKTSLARYVLGYGGLSQTARIRRRTELSRALLIGVDLRAGDITDSPSFPDSDPESLSGVAEILSRAKISCTVKQGWYSIPQLKDELKANDGIDYVYLRLRNVRPSDQVALSCRSPFGGDPVRNGIIKALKEMDNLPRLMVVVPAEPMPEPSTPCWPWLSHLAHEIVEQGVLGVLSLQGTIAPVHLKSFLASFFGDLIKIGQLDTAGQDARRTLCNEPAAWTPVVFSRMRSARLWYLPHFMDENKRGANWKLLCDQIKKGRCTPIIGPGVDYRIARFRRELAIEWANHYQYPMALHEQVNLPQVAQYISSALGESHMQQYFEDDLKKYILRRYGDLLGDASRQPDIGPLIAEFADKVMLRNPHDPHRILARLPFPIYVTANFNNFLAEALVRKERKVEEQVFNADLLEHSINTPSQEHPLVYHLFGQLKDMDSLVLTEDDYFDFLIDIWRERERIPSSVRRAFSSSSLVFLGFNLNDWDFRVLFRSLLKDPSNQRRRKQLHVAVQVDPDDDQITDPDRAREYLEKYFEDFSEGEVSIYWGSSEDFLRELDREWQRNDQ